MNKATLTHELYKLYVQAEAHRAFFVNTVDQMNDHAQRLDVMKQAMATISDIARKVSAGANASDHRASKASAQAFDNDRKIKHGLKKLEVIVTHQGLGIPELGNDVPGSVRDIAVFM